MGAVLKTVTLGCKVNQYETQYVREGLAAVGFRDPHPDGEEADLCVVNTCTVTNEGDAKSRRVIRRLARENPSARIVVMGCYATRDPEAVQALPGVAEVVTDKRELPDLLGRFGVLDLPTGISQFGNRQRAYVKVQDGCLLNCSYCIIPQVRPALTSRPPSHILDECRRLLDHGYRELVLTGVHLGHFGVDWNRGKPKRAWYRLADLVREIVTLPGDFRLRLSSIEATEVTRELVGVMSEFSERICPHLHVCLQSGSDRVLRRMRRRWGAQRFLDRCAQVEEALPAPAFTTDVILGFPGEEEADFEQTCQVIRQVGFSKIHAFPFSPRKGTPAANLEGQIPQQVKAERGTRLAEVEAELRAGYFRRLIGRPLSVLVERVDSSTGRGVGTSCRYAPVELPAGADEIGALVRVSPVAAAGSDRLLVNEAGLGVV